MEIECGEYVRTNNGYITKMTSEDFIKILLEGKSVFGKLLKHSKNIIDLIEVKDVIEINNEKYEVVYDKSFGKLGVLIPNKEQLAIRHCSLEYIFSKNGIEEFKNIKLVTHEQFSNIEYKVETEEK